MNIEARLEQVRAEYLRRMTQGDTRLLRQVEEYTTAQQGKMLRPRMLLTAAATLGTDHFFAERTLLLAVCVEMLHNASLLHDDVIDHADSRRGRPSVNHRWGATVAVLVGDYLLTQIMELLDETGDSDATRKVNATVKAMVEAELLAQSVFGEQRSVGSDATQDGDNQLNTELDAETYLHIIDGKTANLFALAASFGNPLYHDFGLHYGRIFQLRDDIADGEATPHTAALLAIEEDTIKQMENILNI